MVRGSCPPRTLAARTVPGSPGWPRAPPTRRVPSPEVAAQELSVPELISGIALAGGLVAFGRGLLAYRSASRVSSIASSPIVGMAAGEVRITGTVEAGSTTLISPLQSAPCVYFRARVLSQGDRGGAAVGTYFSDERAVQFSVRDGTGVVRVFPRGARWELVARLDEHTGLAGEPPPGLLINTSGSMVATPRDREAQVAALLTVHDPATGAGVGGLSLTGSGLSLLGGGSGTGLYQDRLAYLEYRVEPGDVVTIVGAAVPFGELPDLAAGSDAAEEPLLDLEIAADLEAARTAGLLRPGADGWGNAAIPGFGIAHPTRTPELDPAATPEPVDAMAGGSDRGPGGPLPLGPDGAPVVDFQVDPATLVLASIRGQPMTIYQGSPAEAASRDETAFWLGVGGAALAVIAAAALAIQLTAT